MEAISLKLDPGILTEIDRKLSKYRYSTRTEFIRDAIRTKLSELEKKELLLTLRNLRGSSSRKTTDEQLHKTREKLAKEYEAKFM